MSKITHKLITITFWYNMGISTDQLTQSNHVLQFDDTQSLDTKLSINETPNKRAFKEARSYFK